MDRVTIYKRALMCLGAMEYKEGTPTAGVCDEAYAPVLREACARYDWSFTRRYAKLSRVDGGVHEVMGRVLYRLPADCVRVDEFLTAEGVKVGWPELCGAGVLVPQDEAVGELYVSYFCDLMGDAAVLDEGRTALFVEGVVRLLASRVAMQVTSNAQLGEVLRQEAEGYFWDAITADKQQDWSNAKHPTLMQQAMRRDEMVRF